MVGRGAHTPGGERVLGGGGRRPHLGRAAPLLGNRALAPIQLIVAQIPHEVVLKVPQHSIAILEVPTGEVDALDK